MKHNVTEALLPLLVPMSNLHLDAANTREGHDVEGIANSLVEFGQRTPLVVDAGGKILKGNGTFKAAQSLGWTHIAALRVEDDSVTAVRYSVADNLLGDKSRFNQDTLRQILDTLEEPESIPGADENWLELVRGVEVDEVDYDELWQGMPEFEQEDAGPYQTINVHFANEHDREAFAQLTEQSITDKTKFIWYPKLIRENLKRFTVENES